MRRRILLGGLASYSAIASAQPVSGSPDLSRNTTALFRFEWHTVSFDGKVLYTVKHTTFAGPSKIAFWTKVDGVARYTDLRITQLP